MLDQFKILAIRLKKTNVPSLMLVLQWMCLASCDAAADAPVQEIESTTKTAAGNNKTAADVAKTAADIVEMARVNLQMATGHAQAADAVAKTAAAAAATGDLSGLSLKKVTIFRGNILGVIKPPKADGYSKSPPPQAQFLTNTSIGAFEFQGNCKADSITFNIPYHIVKDNSYEQLAALLRSFKVESLQPDSSFSDVRYFIDNLYPLAPTDNGSFAVTLKSEEIQGKNLRVRYFHPMPSIKVEYRLVMSPNKKGEFKTVDDLQCWLEIHNEDLANWSGDELVLKVTDRYFPTEAGSGEVFAEFKIPKIAHTTGATSGTVRCLASFGGVSKPVEGISLAWKCPVDGLQDGSPSFPDMHLKCSEDFKWPENYFLSGDQLTVIVRGDSGMNFLSSLKRTGTLKPNDKIDDLGSDTSLVISSDTTEPRVDNFLAINGGNLSYFSSVVKYSLKGSNSKRPVILSRKFQPGETLNGKSIDDDDIKAGAFQFQLTDDMNPSIEVTSTSSIPKYIALIPAKDEKLTDFEGRIKELSTKLQNNLLIKAQLDWISGRAHDEAKNESDNLTIIQKRTHQIQLNDAIFRNVAAKRRANAQLELEILAIQRSIQNSRDLLVKQISAISIHGGQQPSVPAPNVPDEKTAFRISKTR